MKLVLLFCLLAEVYGSTECLWAIGRLVCQNDQSKTRNAVVEVWDKDAPKPLKIVDGDDMAGMTVVDNDDGEFKVEGCASDFDWLGPLHKNKPEFYLRIRHNCKSVRGDELVVRVPPAVFAPLTMDTFMENPIVLDA